MRGGDDGPGNRAARVLGDALRPDEGDVSVGDYVDVDSLAEAGVLLAGQTAAGYREVDRRFAGQ